MFLILFVIFAIHFTSSFKQVVLKGIDKGDIVSSGAPQMTKDGSAGRNSMDYMQSRRNKLGMPLDRDIILYSLANAI